MNDSDIRRRSWSGISKALRPESVPLPYWSDGHIAADKEAWAVRQVRIECYRHREDRREKGLFAGGVFDPPLTEPEIDAALARLEAGARERDATAGLAAV